MGRMMCLGAFGVDWQPLAGPWQPLAAPGSPWQPLAGESTYACIKRAFKWHLHIFPYDYMASGCENSLHISLNANYTSWDVPKSRKSVLAGPGRSWLVLAGQDQGELLTGVLIRHWNCGSSFNNYISFIMDY